MILAAPYQWLVLAEPERTALYRAVRPRLTAEQFERIRAMTEAVPELLGLLEKQRISLERVGKVAFGAPTEKTATICGPEKSASSSNREPQGLRKGHGRHGAALTPEHVGSGCLTRASRRGRSVRVVRRASCVASPNQPPPFTSKPNRPLSLRSTRWRCCGADCVARLSPRPCPRKLAWKNTIRAWG